MSRTNKRPKRWTRSVDGYIKHVARSALARTVRWMATDPQVAKPHDGPDPSAFLARASRWLEDSDAQAHRRPDTRDVSSMFAWCRSRGVALARPQYLWSVLRAARTAKSLGIERVCAIEFGVAGGNGLIALESAAEAAESLLGVSVETFGFDTGRGLPEP